MIIGVFTNGNKANCNNIADWGSKWTAWAPINPSWLTDTSTWLESSENYVTICYLNCCENNNLLDVHANIPYNRHQRIETLTFYNIPFILPHTIHFLLNFIVRAFLLQDELQYKWEVSTYYLLERFEFRVANYFTVCLQVCWQYLQRQNAGTNYTYVSERETKWPRD